MKIADLAKKCLIVDIVPFKYFSQLAFKLVVVLELFLLLLLNLLQQHLIGSF